MKAFTILIVGALVLGAGIGGGVIAFTSLGGAPSGEQAQPDFPRPATISRAPEPVAEAAQSQASTDGAGGAPAVPSTSPGELAQLRERFRSGDLSQEELAELRQQFQGGDRFRGPGGAGGGARIVGTIDGIDGGSLSVNTSEGVLTAIVGGDTTINITSEGGVDRLETGIQVSAFGERDESGTLAASIITVISGDGDGQSRLGQFQSGQGAVGGGFAGGQRQRGGGFTDGQALLGTSESIEDGLITIETSQGPLPVGVGADTIVRMTVEGEIGDLVEGMNVVITGESGEDGAIAAVSIRVVPEGTADRFSGGGFFGGGRQGDGQSQ